MERAWQGLVSFVLFVSATLHGVVSPPSHATAQVSTQIPRVDVFGDSVSWESKRWILSSLSHRAQVHAHLFPGTSLCLWLPIMRQVAAEHPSMVLLTFGAELRAPCDHTTDPIRESQDDAGTAADIFKGIRVVLAADPPSKRSSDQAALHAAYQFVAHSHSNVSLNFADRVIAPDDVYSDFLPCLPDESSAMGCVTAFARRVIKVRQPDGVHLCPIVPPIPGQCPMYASGERRFATAVTAPAVAAFPWRPQAIPPVT